MSTAIRPSHTSSTSLATPHIATPQAVHSRIHRQLVGRQSLSETRLVQNGHPVFVIQSSSSGETIDSALNKEGKRQGFSCSSSCVSHYSGLQRLVPEADLPSDVRWGKTLGLIGGEAWNVVYCWARNIPEGNEEGAVFMGDKFNFRWNDAEHGTLYLSAPVGEDMFEYTTRDCTTVEFAKEAFDTAPWCRCSVRYLQLPEVATTWLRDRTSKEQTWKQYVESEGRNLLYVDVLLDIFNKAPELGVVEEMNSILNQFWTVNNLSTLSSDQLHLLRQAITALMEDRKDDDAAGSTVAIQTVAADVELRLGGGKE